MLLHSLSPRARLRALFLAVPVAALTVVAGGSGFAAAETTVATPAITMELSKGKLKFSGPKSVLAGEKLEIVNDTNPKQVGPHTFTLVTKGSLPKTRKAMNSCFAPKRICLAIAQWHGFNPKTERISKNVVRVGAAGWSTMGDAAGKKGDSWYTEKKGATFSQAVTAKAGTTLSYICAVHPEMQGEVEVVEVQSQPMPTS
jgi:plastocyanin